MQTVAAVYIYRLARLVADADDSLRSLQMHIG